MGLALQSCLQNMHDLVLTSAGQAAARAPDAAQVTTLARCYNEVAEVAPRLDVVPLTPSACWSPGKFLELRPAAFQGSELLISCSVVHQALADEVKSSPVCRTWNGLVPGHLTAVKYPSCSAQEATSHELVWVIMLAPSRVITPVGGFQQSQSSMITLGQQASFVALLHRLQLCTMRLL